MDSYMDQYSTGQLDAMHIADGDEEENTRHVTKRATACK
jgi:hypothetical protein